MKITTSLSSVMTGVVLLACAMPSLARNFGQAPPSFLNGGPSGVCAASGCLIVVHVTSACSVYVGEQVLFLGGTAGAQTRKLVWVIKDHGEGFMFPKPTATPPPLVVKGSSDTFGNPDPTSTSPQVPTVSADGRFMAVEFSINNPSDTHYYGLNVADKSGTQCGSIDPWVIE